MSSDRLARALGVLGSGLGAYALLEARKKPQQYVKQYGIYFYQANIGVRGTGDYRFAVIYRSVQADDKIGVTGISPSLLDTTEPANEYYIALRHMEQVKGVATVDWFNVDVITDLKYDTYFTLPSLNSEVIPYTIDLGEQKLVFIIWLWDRAPEYTGAYPYIEYSSDGTSWDSYYTPQIDVVRTRYIRIRIPASNDWPVTENSVFIRELNVIIPKKIEDREYNPQTDLHTYYYSEDITKDVESPLGAVIAVAPPGNLATINYYFVIYRELSKIKGAPIIAVTGKELVPG
jgi:hypothetical protein